MTTRNEVVAVRRSQIVSLSLTELMLLLVFMAITFSFLAKEEGQKEIPRIQHDLRIAEARVRVLEREKAQLKADLHAERLRTADLERFIRSLGYDPRIVPNSGTVPSANRAAADHHTGGNAPGLPRCHNTTGFLFTFAFQADGRIRGMPAWDGTATSTIGNLPGIATIASGKSLSLGEFRSAASKLVSWLDTQNEPCRYSVKVFHETTNISVYESQLSAVEKFFYVKRSSQ